MMYLYLRCSFFVSQQKSEKQDLPEGAATNIVIKQIYQEWKERRKARIEECRNWMPEPYRITPEELEEINQLLEEMDKMEQRGGRGSRGR